jgi:DNA-cytosine methyltransferase
MRHGSLFSGIGGFDLASEWMGWENVFHCEWNLFGQKVLNYYWPKAITYHDITKTDFTIHRGTIDILTGGFPCQPYSMAGKRLGKEDERHLWPEMLRAIREIQPTWVVGENVFGLVNWNGGLVFHEVQADLEAQGYEVQPYVLPACAVNAPHRRDRIWFVAYSKSCADSRNTREVSRKTKEENGGWIEPSTTSEQQVQLLTKSSSLFGAFKNSNKDGWRGDEWEKESNIGEQRNIGSGDNEQIPTNDEKIGTDTDSDISTKRPSGESGGTKEDRSKDNLQQGEWRKKTELDNRLYEFPQYATDSDNKGLERSASKRIQGNEGRGNRIQNAITTRTCNERNTTDSKSARLQGMHKTWSKDINNWENTKIRGSIAGYDKKNYWKNFPTVSPICDGDDGISDRLDSITFSKWRNESIKAGGNAIVPQVVHQIFKAIEQYETTRQT